MNITIFTMTHKPFNAPAHPMYMPLHVGREGKEDFGYPGDNTGDHISHLNCYYSELTGFYWIWKNYKKDDYIGTCHYRRFLIDEKEQVLNTSQYKLLLSQYDLITTKRVILNNSYHFGFSANHNIEALDVTGEVIRDLYPEYYDDFVRLVNGNETYFGNMLVTSHKLFDEYCEWLFTIFFEVSRRINPDPNEDAYHKRVFGFISEFLLYVWVTTKKLRVCEMKVGMIGEKAETRELKETIGTYFAKKDIDGAKSYFLQVLQKRPDVLMEASDITGELRLTMQIISTLEHERENHLSPSLATHPQLSNASTDTSTQKQENAIRCHTLLDRECDLKKLIALFRQLNKATRHYYNDLLTDEDIAFLKDAHMSESALYVAAKVLGKDEESSKEFASIYSHSYICPVD